MTQALPPFLLTTDAKRKPDPWNEAMLLPPGQGIVFRHYDAPNRHSMALALSRLARRRRLILLIASDWRMAAKLKASGVHLPEYLLCSGHVAPILGWARRTKRLITAACHSRSALARARKLKISAALVSPVFSTDSHPGARPLGVLRFTALCRGTAVPVYALGGIRRNIGKRSTACGMAGTIPLNTKP